MRELSHNRCFSLVLIAAIVLAQLVCICASHAATSSRPLQATATVDHDCCDDKTPAPHSDSPSEHKHEHDKDCQHCASTSKPLIVAERAEPLTSPQWQPALIPFASAVLADLLRPSSVDYQAFTLWLSDPSPPPDILRVKCTLQI